MRFADQREAAAAAVEGSLSRDFRGDRKAYARKVVRVMQQPPQPETVETIGKGDKKRRLVYDRDRNRKARRELGLVKPRVRLRKTLQPHWLKAMIDEKRSEQALLVKLVEEDRKLDQ